MNSDDAKLIVYEIRRLAQENLHDIEIVIATNKVDGAEEKRTFLENAPSLLGTRSHSASEFHDRTRYALKCDRHGDGQFLTIECWATVGYDDVGEDYWGSQEKPSSIALTDQNCGSLLAPFELEHCRRELGAAPIVPLSNTVRLFEAMRVNDVQVAEGCLRHKFDKSVLSYALIKAVRNEHPDCIKLLLIAGADAYERVKGYRKSALEYAQDSQHRETRELLGLTGV